MVLAREVDDLLHAMDVRRERGHDDAARRVREDAVEAAADRLLRRAVARDQARWSSR